MTRPRLNLKARNKAIKAMVEAVRECPVFGSVEVFTCAYAHIKCWESGKCPIFQSQQALIASEFKQRHWDLSTPEERKRERRIK